MSYNDDDWSGSGFNGLNVLYAEVKAVEDPVLTTADDYNSKLKENYEWVHVMAHSTSDVHIFWLNGKKTYFNNYAIINTDPLVSFYNLFACSNARYDANNYMAGHYIFNRTYSMAAIGSTKIGSMLNDSKFYEQLNSYNKKNIGEAFKIWFTKQNLADHDMEGWFYGMTLIGDPTLVLYPSGTVTPSPTPTIAYYRKGWNYMLLPNFGISKLPSGCSTYSYKKNIWEGFEAGYGMNETIPLDTFLSLGCK